MKKQRVSILGIAIISSVLSLVGLVAPNLAYAASTCTWTGAGSTTTFSTAANWSNCGGVAPQAADTISFGTLSGNPSVTLTNDLGHAVAGLVIASSASGSTNYTIDTLTMASGATIDQSNSENGSGYTNFAVTSVTSQGALTIVGGGRLNVTNWTLNGVLTLGSGARFDGTKVGSSGVVVQSGAQLAFYTPNSATPSTPNYPITLGGGSGSGTPTIYFYYPYNTSSTTWTLANSITLAGNATVTIGDPKITVDQTGSISGAGFALSLDSSSATGGKLILAPSSNTSATVPGTYTGSGAGFVGGAGSTVTATTKAKTPNTGFGPAESKTWVGIVGAVLVSGVLFAATRGNRKFAHGRR